jgi:hypothetical protein
MTLDVFWQMLVTGAEPPLKLGGQIEKKKFGRAKIRKNNKIWGKILIFLNFFKFFGKNLGLQGGSTPVCTAMSC